MALKAAINSLKIGDHDNALVIGSELASRLLKKSRYEAATEAICSERIDFDAEFLRWMLSDGAGAVLLQNKPAPRGLSLRVDWMRSFSHADAFPTCMSVGHSGKQGETKRWQDYETYADAEKDGAILIRQDDRLLENIVKLGVDGFLRLIEEDVVHADAIDHFVSLFVALLQRVRRTAHRWRRHDSRGKMVHQSLRTRQYWLCITIHHDR